MRRTTLIKQDRLLAMMLSLLAYMLSMQSLTIIQFRLSHAFFSCSCLIIYIIVGRCTPLMPSRTLVAEWWKCRATNEACKDH